MVAPDGTFILRAKMLTGSWNELPADTPTNFSVLGYSVDTIVTWENGGTTLVNTSTTTAADGYFASGWTSTTRIEHELTAEGELCIRTITPDGEYCYWMTREPPAAAASE